MIRPPPRSPLFPYTTLFRSSVADCNVLVVPAISATSVTWSYTVTNRSEEHTSELQSHSNLLIIFSFFLNDTATTEISPLSLHDALPIFCGRLQRFGCTGYQRDFRHLVLHGYE